MDPITTGTTWTQGVVQTFSSLLGSFAPHWMFVVGGLAGSLLIVLFIYSATASIVLGLIAQTLSLGVLALLGILPWWIVVISGVITVPMILLNTFRGPLGDGPEGQKTKEDTDLTNQLIQKQVREIQEQKARAETWPSGLLKTAPVAVPTYVTLEDRVSSSLSGFDKGRKAFSSLKSEYDGLVMLFGGSRVNDTLINTDRTKQIVADVYTKGLSFIEQAANVFKQIKLSDYDTLKMETDELSGELQAKSADSAVYKTLKQVIDKNNNILDLVKKNKDSIDELLAQSTLCKDSIEEIRLQLPSIVNYQSAEELEKPLAELKQRIDFAQKLQTEFKAQGL